MEPCSLIAAFLVPHLRGSIPHTLQEIKALCVPMRENCMVCLRVYARLHQIWQRELQFVPTARLLRQRVAPVLGRYVELLVRFAELLKKFATDDCLFRLILSRQLFVKLGQLHRDIDAVVLALVAGGGDHERGQHSAPRGDCQEHLVLTRVQWEADRKVQQQLDRHRSGYTAVVQSELRAIDTEGGMLSEVRDALAEEAKGSSSAVKAETNDNGTILLLFVVNTHDAIGRELIRMSSWRLVRRDFVDIMISSVSEASSQSKSPTTRTGAVQPRGNSELLRILSGCRLVKSHSACHLCTPVVFAFDRMATSSNFGEFVNALRKQLMSLFYSVELSLHYPHEKELFSSSGSDDNSQTVGVCDFGFANLSISQDKRRTKDITTTLLIPST